MAMNLAEVSAAEGIRTGPKQQLPDLDARPASTAEPAKVLLKG